MGALLPSCGLVCKYWVPTVQRKDTRIMANKMSRRSPQRLLSNRIPPKGAEDPETDPRKQRLAFEFQWHLGEEAPRHQWQNLRVTRVESLRKLTLTRKHYRYHIQRVLMQKQSPRGAKQRQGELAATGTRSLHLGTCVSPGPHFAC